MATLWSLNRDRDEPDCDGGGGGDDEDQVATTGCCGGAGAVVFCAVASTLVSVSFGYDVGVVSGTRRLRRCTR